MKTLHLDSVGNKDLWRVSLRGLSVVTFAMLTAAGSCVRIPVPGSPVPITLQTLFAILSGAFLGSRLGPASQLVYIGMGCSGLQVFQGSACGPAYIAGPTGGYLAGFVAASWVSGKLLHGRSVSFGSALCAFCLADITVYLLGAPWLCLFVKDLPSTLALGVWPFLAGDVAKICAAAASYKAYSSVGIGR